MKFNFDRIIDRRNTHSYKWDQSGKLFGSEDIMPLWVADMDFESPPAVKEALVRRAELGIYGYSIKSNTYVEAIVRWFERRHHWTLRPEWTTDSPGIVTSLSLAVELYSEPGSQVILQSPVYYPFYDVIRMNGREVAKNPLILRDGRYEMDYAHLEELMRGGAKLLLLCSPHNPGGRIWDREELLRLGELCLRHGVTVISDEIHCDLALPGHTHVPFASLSEELANITLTCLAPTKTFNLPGIQSSFIVASNPDIKRKFDMRMKTLSLHMTNFFVPDAVQAAYNEGDEWLDELLQYIDGNVEYAIRYLSEHLPQIEVMRPDGTYLLWLDCRGLRLDVKGLKKLMFEEARVAFSEGSVFGTEAEGYLRINLACPRSLLQEALERFCTAAAAYAVK
ncbi:MalY/PatB family protein [Paenibacillus allorhizosphaerae]|uniref:Cystathionine beta-lyase PatB n=1 Tax=Paenibacillus allorhizosphaerae TaxID=2849866 RepID=A0ABN7TWQ9_9BACL|nr:MalY/PatB family protein [Paenibacillus allorhizosphaerae]CAG7653653.1 Cystathionine beta-lyase PatB [Paenibacillus allorhizosphaerae]